jgi:hypothetical protein
MVVRIPEALASRVGAFAQLHRGSTYTDAAGRERPASPGALAALAIELGLEELRRQYAGEFVCPSCYSAMMNAKVRQKES